MTVKEQEEQEEVKKKNKPILYAQVVSIIEEEIKKISNRKKASLSMCLNKAYYGS